MKTIAQQLNVTDFPFKIKDNNGKEIYYETSAGYWNKKQYDSNGNIIYFEDSDGYWNKSEYDSSNNKLTYYESSKGYWTKYEYDNNGNKIYFENSNGRVVDNRTKSACEDKTILNNLIYDHIIDLTNFFMEKYLNNEIKDIKQVCNNIMNKNNNIFSMDIQYNGDTNIADFKVQLKNNIEYFTFNIDFN